LETGERLSSEGPLAGLLVLDLSRVLAGPFCTMLLADLGARVVKVEYPDGGDVTRGWGPPWEPSPGSRRITSRLTAGAVVSAAGVTFVASPIRVEGRTPPLRFPPKLDENGEALRCEFGLPSNPVIPRSVSDEESLT
jgi:hypothetical protein